MINNQTATKGNEVTVGSKTFDYMPLPTVFGKDAPVAEQFVATEIHDNELFFKLLKKENIVLNPPQKEAVKTVDGPLLLLAGAGSGKTTTLTSRIAYLIHTKLVNPHKILLVTFTNKASKDMLERLGQIPGLTRKQANSVVTGTFHSICFRILRAEGYQFKILSSEKRKEMIIKSILRKKNLQDDYTTEAILSNISTWKNNGLDYSDIHTDGNEVLEEVVDIYRLYEEAKQKNKELDFDDLLLKTWKLLIKRSAVLAKYQKMFEYIMCDEYQDSSYLQVEILKLLAAPHHNLAVCGDEGQTIYSFRSASPKYMLEFKKVYPEAKQIIMDINYRSVGDIVGLGNNIIAQNKYQIKKTLKVVKEERNSVFFARPETKEEEARQIVARIKEKHAAGQSLRDIAVIYRTHAMSRAIFEELLNEGIPFVTFQKTNTFYDGLIVKPIVQMFRAIQEPTNVQAMIDSATALYISKAAMEAAIEHINMSFFTIEPEEVYFKALEYIASSKSGFQKNQLIRKIDVMRKFKHTPMKKVLELVRNGEGLGYEKLLEIDERKMFSINKETIKESLNEFEQSVSRFKLIDDFLQFLDELEETNRQMERIRKDPNADVVQMLTVHASKGLEFKSVFAIGWSEGMLPHACSMPSDKDKKIVDSPLTPEEAMEEERRIAYVAATRAIQELYISSPAKNHNKDCEISRFILEGMGVQKKK